MTYDFDKQVLAWSQPPVAGRNMHAMEALGFTDAQLVRWVEEAFQEHYGQDSNADNRMRELLGLDDTQGKTILDFGCGFGFDALCYARAGNSIMLADITPSNVIIARRILQVFGFSPPTVIPITNEPPFFESPAYDIFHANGVLHHSPHARAIIERANVGLRPGGEMRLMLYHDNLFKIATGVSVEAAAKLAPERREELQQVFVRYADAVGDYAETYSLAKLAEVIEGTDLEVFDWDYLRSDQGYAVAILRRRQ